MTSQHVFLHNENISDLIQKCIQISDVLYYIPWCRSSILLQSQTMELHCLGSIYFYDLWQVFTSSRLFPKLEKEDSSKD